MLTGAAELLLPAAVRLCSRQRNHVDLLQAWVSVSALSLTMPGKVATTAKGLNVPPLAVVLMVVLLSLGTATVSADEHSGLGPKTTPDPVVDSGPRSFLDRVLIAFPFTPSSVVAADLVSVLFVPLPLILSASLSIFSSPLPFVGQAFFSVGCTPSSFIGVSRRLILVGHDC